MTKESIEVDTVTADAISASLRYELLEITGDGFYRVYSEAVEDWALCSPNDFELVEPLQREER